MKAPTFWLNVLLVSLLATAQAADEKKRAAKEARQDLMAEDLKGRQGAEFENVFLAYMIHHHQGGVKMAQLAKEQAEMAEVKKLAEKMIPIQTQEIEQMTGWLKARSGKTPEDYPMPERSQKKAERELAKLKEASGGEFDQLFLKQMSDHHRGGVAMSELVLEPGRTERAELKELAQEIATQQTQEIEEMRALRKKG
jgi:uncharacterized protein (DUF305 family)